MAMQDILDRTFGLERAANDRMENMPSIGPANPPPPSPLPTAPAQPSQGSRGMESLLPLLLAEKAGGGGGGGGGQGLSSFSPGGGAGTGLAQRIGGWIDSRPGFTVGGLEGYNGTGQISTGHIDNSQHYTGHAGDVSYVGGGRFGGEMQALDWLYNKLNRRWGDALTELIWRQDDHWDHLHYGTRPGG